MNCPLCNTELVIRGESQYQNLEDHVCDKDILHNLKTAPNLLLENDSEEGIILG